MARIAGIGIIGLDHWYWALGSAYHIALNRKSKLVAISDTNPALARKIAKAYGAKTWFTDYEELLKSTNIDSVVITSTTDMHPKIAIDAAKAGKNILIGKPIARTLKEADQIIKSANKAKIKLVAMATGPMKGDRVKMLIEEGVIGSPYAAHSAYNALLPTKEPCTGGPGWFADPNKAAGGAFIDHAIYSAANLRCYFNSEASRVYAEMGRFVHKNLSIEDYGVAVIRFVDGSIATIEATFTSPTETHHTTKITGTNGEIERRDDVISIWSSIAPYKNPTVIKISQSSYAYDKLRLNVSIPTPPFAKYYRQTIEHFIDYITEDVEPISTGKDARAALEICLGAYESLRTKKPVSLPLSSEVDVPSILARL